MEFRIILLGLIFIFGCVYAGIFVLASTSFGPSKVYKTNRRYIDRVYAGLLILFFFNFIASTEHHVWRSMFIVVGIAVFVFTLMKDERRIPLVAVLVCIWMIIFGSNVILLFLDRDKINSTMPYLFQRVQASLFGKPYFDKVIGLVETKHHENCKAEDEDYNMLNMSRYLTNGYFNLGSDLNIEELKSSLHWTLGPYYRKAIQDEPLKYFVGSGGGMPEESPNVKKKLLQDLPRWNSRCYFTINGVESQFERDDPQLEEKVWSIVQRINHNAPKAYIISMLSQGGVRGQILTSLLGYLHDNGDKTGCPVFSPKPVQDDERKMYSRVILDEQKTTLKIEILYQRCLTGIDIQTTAVLTEILYEQVSSIDIDYSTVPRDVDLVREVFLPSTAFDVKHRLAFTFISGHEHKQAISEVLDEFPQSLVFCKSTT